MKENDGFFSAQGLFSPVPRDGATKTGLKSFWYEYKRERERKREIGNERKGKGRKLVRG